MRIVLQFDLPKEQDEYNAAKNGWAYRRDREALTALLLHHMDEATGDLRESLKKIYKEFINEITVP